MNPAIVVPWRAGNADREQAWAWCRPWWEQFGWPLFEVEHPPPVPFNRSWCINEGARRAGPDWDVLIAIDADVFEEDPEQVRHGVASALETGRLTVPHTTGSDLSLQGTRLLLEGRSHWARNRAAIREVCTSRVTIIPRDLFERVGGFDQRFQGWGHEDVAFWAATVPVRGVDQFPGVCWHLWHKPSLNAAKATQEWRNGARLADRYLDAFRNGNPALQKILDERTYDEKWAPDQSPGEAVSLLGATDVIVLTAGRREYLERTLRSFEERVHGKIGRRTIQDDSGDPDFAAWLAETYPTWTIITTPGKIGFTEAIRSIWNYELSRNGQGAPYIFHLEEDFVFDQDIHLDQMISVLESDTKLAQVALLRGPWAPDEIQAGGIIQQHPGSYARLEANGIQYLRHRRYFTTNPCLYRRSIMERGWPAIKNSEIAFTKKLRTRGMQFAYLGDGEPQVTHIGDERVGIGY